MIFSKINNFKKTVFKEMKKIEYMTPEMEVLDLKLGYSVLLNTSGNDPEVHDEISEGDPDD